MNGFEVVKEAVPVEDYARTLTELKPEELRRLVGWCPVRDALKEMRWIAASELAGIPNLDERAEVAALASNGLLAIAQILVARPPEDAR